MSSQNGFPQTLLNQPPAARLSYFKAFTMAHPLLKEAYEKLRNVIREPAGTSLVFVTGPAGVGKTTLRFRLVQKLTEEALASLAATPGRIPVVGIEAIGPDSVNWNWKDYYRRLLFALDEPLLDSKVKPDGWVNPRERKYSSLLPNEVAAELRQSVEQALRHRQPLAVVIDEAQHISRIASGRKLQDQLDCIKSLANMTQTVHVLVGSYELLAFRNLSGQLSRRSIDVHFGRYRADSASDVEAFLNVLHTFEQHLPLKKESNLTHHWDYLYERSNGCVGVLKDWLSRTLAVTLERGKESVTLKDLTEQALSVSQCEKMITEALEGESMLQEKKESSTRLRKLLGIDTTLLATPGPCATGDTISQQNSESSRRPKARVGVPNPKRYPIGTKNDATESACNL
jgi:hypothetical protein